MSENHCSCGCSHEGPENQPCEQEQKDVENSTDDDQSHDVPLPDPTMTDLVRGLATQAMLSMGVFPHPQTGQSTILLHQAKHLIDTIEMLLEKTRGNITEAETKMIDSALHELRMIYIAAQNEKARREG